jgi:hypothetical protein
MYSPASCYVLMARILPGEEQCAIVHNINALQGCNNLTYLLDRWEDIMW